MYLKNKRFRITVRFPERDYQLLRFLGDRYFGDCPSDACRACVRAYRAVIDGDPKSKAEFDEYIASHPLSEED